MRNSLLLCLVITLNLISYHNVMGLPSIEIKIEDPHAEKFIPFLNKNKIHEDFVDNTGEDDENAVITYPQEMVVTTMKLLTHDFGENTNLNVTIRLKAYNEHVGSTLMNVMILDNREQFHNNTLFEPFSKVQLEKWSDLVYGEFIEGEAKELYIVHNCYTNAIFIVRGEIVINGSESLNFKYQKICPKPDDRGDLKLKIASEEEKNVIISKLEDSKEIIRIAKDPTWIKIRFQKGNQIVSHVTFKPVKKAKGIELKVKGGREGELVKKDTDMNFVLLADCKKAGNYELHFNVMIYPFKSIFLKFQKTCLNEDGYVTPNDIAIMDLVLDKKVFMEGKLYPRYDIDSKKEHLVVSANQSFYEFGINVDSTEKKLYTLDNAIITSKEAIVAAEYIGRRPQIISDQHSQFVISFTCHSAGSSPVDVTLLLSQHGKIEFSFEKDCSQEQVIEARSKKGWLYYIFIIIAIILGCYLTMALKRMMMKAFNKYQPVPKTNELSVFDK